jgi:putative ABC transport system permease protein
MSTEPMRAVSARLRFGAHEHRGAVQGVPATQHLFKVYDASGHAVDLPREGLVLSTMLAKVLGAKIGDSSRSRCWTAGDRYSVRLSSDVRDLHRHAAYMEIGALNRLMRERPSVSSVQIEADPRQYPALFRELKRIPEVSP